MPWSKVRSVSASRSHPFFSPVVEAFRAFNYVEIDGDQNVEFAVAKESPQFLMRRI